MQLKEMSLAQLLCLYCAFYTQKLYSGHTTHTVHYQDQINIQILDITTDGLEVSSKLHNQLEGMTLPHSLLEINFVKIILELMLNGLNSTMDFINHSWMMHHKRHGNGGTGPQPTAELGDFGDMSILTIREEHGSGLTTNQQETVPIFENFDDSKIYL
jgi:hypothetical protein